MQVATVHQIQALVRGRRREVNVTQESLARTAGVSRKWLSEFERGTTTAVELPLVLRVLAALDLVVEVNAPRTGPVEVSAGPAESEAPDLDEILNDYNTRKHR